MGIVRRLPQDWKQELQARRDAATREMKIVRKPAARLPEGFFGDWQQPHDHEQQQTPREAAAAQAEKQEITRQRHENGVSFTEHQARAWSEITGLFHDSQLFAHPPETPNGPGCTIESTQQLRVWLPDMLERYGVKTMLDAACGDANWMRLVDLGDVDYLGWDSEAESVAICARRVIEGNWTGTSDPTFERVNLLTVPQVPKVDLILCRQFLQHLTNEHITAVLDKFKASGSRYLLTTHYPAADNDFQYDPACWSWFGYMERPLNLEWPPFSLGPKIEAFAETPGPAGVISQPHELALWQINHD